MKKYLIVVILGLILLTIGCSNKEKEPNNSFNGAQEISPDKPIACMKNNNDRYDFFKVTAVDKAMEVSISHVTPNASDSNFQVHIYDFSKKELGYYVAKNGIDNAMTFGVTPKSIYYVKVNLNGAAIKREYNLSVNFSSDTYEAEPNDSFNDAQKIKSGEYLGQNNGSDSNDYFKVTAENNAMSVGLTHITPNASDSNFQVRVYDVSKKELGYYDARNGVDNAMTFGVVSGDVYYIKVFTNRSPARNRYKLAVNFSSDIYEAEPNDSFNDAQPIKSGEYLGQNNGNDSNDYFKVTAENNAMSVGITHITPNASDSNFQVRLYNVSKKELGYYNARNGVDNAMTFGVISGETYYIRIFTNQSPASRQYKLAINFSNDIYEIEPNDSFNEARQIKSGEYLGQNNGNDSNDFFAVTAASNLMTVGFTHLTLGASDSNFQVRLYDVSKKDLGYFNAKAGVDKKMTFKVISGSRYYVRVLIFNSSSYSQYKLKLGFE